MLAVGTLNAWLCVRASPTNSDFVQCLLVAHAMLAGNVLLRGWTLASDNFLFTDVPGALAGLVMFREWRHALLVGPAIVMPLIMLSSLWLAIRDGVPGRGRLVATAMIAALVFTPDVHELGGVLGVPAQHGASLLAALLLMLMLQGADRACARSVVPGFWIVSTLLIFSDPFSVVFFFAPLGLLLAARALHRDRPSFRLLLAVVAACAVAAAAKPLVHAAGGFSTRAALTTELVDWAGLQTDFATVGRDLLRLAGGDAGAYSRLFGYVALAIAVVAIAAGLRPVSLGGPAVLRPLLALCVLSSIAACLISEQFHRAIGPGVTFNADERRYLAPAVVFGWLLASLWAGSAVEALPARRARPLAAVVVLACAVQSAIGSARNLRTLSAPAAIVTQPQFRLADWLAARGLTRGVGSYWEGSSITVLSNGRVVVRAVLGSGGRLVPFDWLADQAWYGKARPQFVVFTRGEWFDIDEPAIAGTYGKPAWVTDVDGFTVAGLKP